MFDEKIFRVRISMLFQFWEEGGGGVQEQDRLRIVPMAESPISRPLNV